MAMAKKSMVKAEKAKAVDAVERAPVKPRAPVAPVKPWAPVNPSAPVNP